MTKKHKYYVVRCVKNCKSLGHKAGQFLAYQNKGVESFEDAFVYAHSYADCELLSDKDLKKFYEIVPIRFAFESDEKSIVDKPMLEDFDEVDDFIQTWQRLAVNGEPVNVSYKSFNLLCEFYWIEDNFASLQRVTVSSKKARGVDRILSHNIIEDKDDLYDIELSINGVKKAGDKISKEIEEFCEKMDAFCEEHDIEEDWVGFFTDRCGTYEQGYDY